MLINNVKRHLMLVHSIHQDVNVAEYRKEKEKETSFSSSRSSSLKSYPLYGAILFIAVIRLLKKNKITRRVAIESLFFRIMREEGFREYVSLGEILSDL